MKILVIDNEQTNLDSAIMQLGDEHEVITASSYDEAEKYLAGLIPHVYGCGRWDNIEREKGSENGFKKYHFDVILTDLFMPASRRAGSSSPSVGEEPLGLVIAMAALRINIPVAIVSMGGHHSNQFSWAMDLIGMGDYGRDPYRIGNTPFVYTTVADDVEVSDGVYAKTWREALDGLLSIM